MRKVVITSGLRTPFVKANKEFASIHPADLAAKNLREFLFQSDLKGEEIDEVILGNVANLTDAINIARVALLRAGFPKKIPAVTVHRNCASSLESIIQGTAKIKAKMADIILAGGVESMSCVPLLFNSFLHDFTLKLMGSKKLSSKLKTLLSFRLNFLIPRIALKETLTDPTTGFTMGETAEILAKEFTISRKDQDQFAIESHQKAFQQKDKLKEEMFPVFAGPDYKAVSEDRGVRQSVNLSRFQRARPYFDKKCGTVTILNSCPMNDGSSLVLLMAEEKAHALGLKPLVSIHSTAYRGLEPERMGLGPVYASALALQKAGLSLKDMDLIEINEAFAAQVLACLKAFASDTFAREKLGLSKAVGEVDRKRLNVNGGAIAIGHPVSATGARLVFTMAKELKRRNKQWGLVTLCIGGGQGGAVILENKEY